MTVKSHLLASCVALIALFNTTQLSAESDPVVRVVETTDLAADAVLAAERNLPILLMFSMDGCAYCEVIKSDFLVPMLISGDYQDKVIIRMVKVDSYNTLTDFDGSSIEAADLPDRYGAFATPTLVFVNHRGKELAPRLVGLGTIGFFGGDIDAAIDHSLTRLRSVALKSTAQ